MCFPAFSTPESLWIPRVRRNRRGLQVRLSCPSPLPHLRWWECGDPGFLHGGNGTSAYRCAEPTTIDDRLGHAFARLVKPTDLEFPQIARAADFVFVPKAPLKNRFSEQNLATKRKFFIIFKNVVLVSESEIRNINTRMRFRSELQSGLYGGNAEMNGTGSLTLQLKP